MKFYLTIEADPVEVSKGSASFISTVYKNQYKEI
jgi:hypothetical protein